MEVRELAQAVERNYRIYQNLYESLDMLPRDNQPLRDTIRKLLLDLSDMETEIVEHRLSKILEEENPYIAEIRVEDLRRFSPFGRLTLAELMDGFLLQRSRLVKTIGQLPPMQWNRTGLHAREGHITFGELIRRLVRKDDQIIAHLRRLIPLEDSMTV